MMAKKRAEKYTDEQATEYLQECLQHSIDSFGGIVLETVEVALITIDNRSDVVIRWAQANQVRSVEALAAIIKQRYDDGYSEGPEEKSAEE